MIRKGETLFPRIDVDKEIEALTQLIGNTAGKEKASKAEEKKAPVRPVGLAQIGIEDFAKVELRAAKGLACEPVKRAKKLLKLHDTMKTLEG